MRCKNAEKRGANIMQDKQINLEKYLRSSRRWNGWGKFLNTLLKRRKESRNIWDIRVMIITVHSFGNKKVFRFEKRGHRQMCYLETIFSAHCLRYFPPISKYAIEEKNPFEKSFHSKWKEAFESVCWESRDLLCNLWNYFSKEFPLSI